MLAGLLALVGVAVAIGLLGGLAVMVGVKATGLDGTTTATDESATPSTFNLPKPTDTGSSVPAPEESVEPSPGEETSEAPAEAISLTVGAAVRQPDAADRPHRHLPGRRGRGPPGAALRERRVVRLPGHRAGVGRHVRHLRADRPDVGPNRFRVIDTDSEAISNEVTVTVG